MFKQVVWILAAAFFVLKSHTVVAAEDCGPLQQINTIDLKMSAFNNRAYLPVFINGVQKSFMLDTGGFATQIWPSAAKELNLPITNSGGTILDLYGHASGSAAMISTFGLGRMQAKDTTILISTFDNPNDEAQHVGILAPDFMGSYDVELDFAGHKMNYFLTNHCDGHVIYWPAATIAVVPMVFRQDHHIVIPVTLDGHEFRALIDTGAPTTLIRAPEASRVFGITEPGSGDFTMADIQGEKQFAHIFQSLDLEGISIKQPRIVVFPDLIGRHDPNNGAQTGSHVKRDDDMESQPAIIIGMDILSKLHLYIAFKEQKLYVTPASSPAAAISPIP